jgi:hypothetical protein
VKRRLFNLAAVVSLAMMLAFAAYFAATRLAHRGEGPRYDYPLRGNEVLTDQQAVDLAKQTLQRDGRFSDKLELVTLGNGSTVNRGSDRSYVSVCWENRDTHEEWYVQLHRSPERVEAISYPGK